MSVGANISVNLISFQGMPCNLIDLAVVMFGWCLLATWHVYISEDDSELSHSHDLTEKLNKLSPPFQPLDI